MLGNIFDASTQKKKETILKTQNFLLFFLIIALFVAPVFAGTSDGTATVEDGTEDPPSTSPPGTTTEPILFDLSITKIPDYIILPLHSSIPVTIHADSRNNRNAEMVIVWTIVDSNDVAVKNGSFSHLFYEYEEIDFDVELPAPKEEGHYVLRIDVFNNDNLSGTTSSPFHVYGILSFLLGGPGWWLLAIFVAAGIIILSWLLRKRL